MFYSKTNRVYVGMCKAWPYGNITVGDVTASSCFYMSKYTLKQTKEDFARLKEYKQQAPFRLMSRNPGLGFDYLDKVKYQIYQDGYIRFKGSKIQIPRYYFDKLYPLGSNDREFVQMDKRKVMNDANDEFYRHYLSLGESRYFIDNRLGEQQEINFMKRS